MRSSRPAARPLYTPAADFNQRKLPVTDQPARAWFRLHRSGMAAVHFGISRHHRFSHPRSPFPWLYVGASPAVCLREYFGDDVISGRRTISAGKWAGCSLSQIAVPRLKVCAVSHEPTRDAVGMDKASLLAVDLSIPQSWGLAIQTHPACVEAIKYSSRFMDLPCLALFDRGGLAAQLSETLLGSLDKLDVATAWLDERKVALV